MSMGIFGKNGLIRKQEVAFARKLLIRKYENAGIALPDKAFITAHAEKVVEEAHAIAMRSGSNILEILKAQINNLRK